MRVDAYERALSHLNEILEGVDDTISRMATVVAVLKQEFPHFYWIGFYRHIGGELLIGPYQGTFGCLRIAIGRGVCGTAAGTRKTQIVPDVHAFPGHIACDSASRSEIVVPVLNKDKDLIAVLDIDSTELDTFDQLDAHYLESILEHCFRSCAPA